MKKLVVIILLSIFAFTHHAGAFSFNTLFSESGLDEESPDVIAGKSSANTFLFSNLNQSIDALYNKYSTLNQQYKKLHSKEFLDSFKYFANPYGEYAKEFLTRERARQSNFNLVEWIGFSKKIRCDSKESFDIECYLSDTENTIHNEQEFCNRIIDENSYLKTVRKVCPSEFNNTAIQSEHLGKYYVVQGCNKYRSNDSLKPSERDTISDDILTTVMVKMSILGEEYCSIERLEAEPLLHRYQKFFNIK
ncbi:hypothetical protein [Mannheimia varigena]|uniref:hypothetical protein n=1 Tax=Mannheimia varigena TaxID=85404 RepID=UPI0015B7313A|nr:hypothetical protein [Mannheimia varigena]QLD33163.1 hypothetical protein A6B42_05020 [Mannheimia varigena]